MKYLFFIFFLAGFMVFCNYSLPEKKSELILLKNDKTEVGIVPSLGGRVVKLRIPGMDNILKSDPAQWSDPAIRPDISAFSDFTAFDGHIVWLGPQSEWWVKQDLNPLRKEQRAVWPPDPYLIYGDYAITDQTDTSIVMRGPESPVSGIQLMKKISIRPDGSVLFEAAAKNIRNEPVSWGLWMNTRLDGFARCYVPADEEGLLRLSVKQGGREMPVPHAFKNGYFFFEPRLTEKKTARYVQKAFIHPTDTFIAGFSGNQAVRIGFERVNPERIHSDQAAVEIYNMISSDETLLEMEAHGPYTTLQPGESITLQQIWHLFEYHGENRPECHIRFINENMRDEKTGF